MYLKIPAPSPFSLLPFPGPLHPAPFTLHPAPHILYLCKNEEVSSSPRKIFDS